MRHEFDFPDGSDAFEMKEVFEEANGVRVSAFLIRRGKITFITEEPEPEYRCNQDCWLYGRRDESDDFFPCSHCYKIG